MRPAAAMLSTLVCLAGAAAGSVQATTCTARSGATPPRVVELYTSEGCSSCPPADVWLSTLKGRADVIALGFHVTYWDRLGWPDRFANEAYTRRQHEIAARHGSSSVYTPQVVVDGLDWRGWPRLPQAAAASSPSHSLSHSRPHSPPEVTLTRAADGQVQAHVSPAAGADATQTLTAYWAVVEHQHTSRVRTGENAGETLRHDHVVRLHRTLPAFAAREGLTSRLDVPPGVAAHPRRIVFVVTSLPDARPLQAVALDC
ncbi:MAG: DUF1223 domain-containing protein [Burkholderiales bacterium]|nr:DUF1223 domain-containing protein [Burkholderiales bacterium]